MTPDIERAARAIRDERLKWLWTEPGKKVTALDELLAIAVLSPLAEPSDAAVEAACAAYINAGKDMHEWMRAALRAARLAELGRTG